MGISHLDFHKPPSLVAYGTPYHAFTFPGNVAIIYYPETSKVMFKKKFPPHYEFTSLIIRQGMYCCNVVLIGLSNGQILKIDSYCDTHLPHSNVKFKSEIGSPRDVWQHKNRPSQKGMTTRSQAKPIKLWGADRDDLFYSRES
jgi:hypothetical protein